MRCYPTVFEDPFVAQSEVMILNTEHYCLLQSISHDIVRPNLEQWLAALCRAERRHGLASTGPTKPRSPVFETSGKGNLVNSEKTGSSLCLPGEPGSRTSPDDNEKCDGLVSMNTAMPFGFDGQARPRFHSTFGFKDHRGTFGIPCCAGGTR